MKIPALVFLAFTAISSAAPDSREAAFLAEWKRTRTALERAGYRVNHFANTPFAIAQEQREIRRQIEQRCNPRTSQGNARIGGRSYSAPTSRIRKAPPIGKLGATRRMR